ncbi:RNA polymerase II elongation factor Ell-like [Bactrocera dorsalis]|uniref:RNA polymerase II elongation factor Ell-like n=1 Tax=Bactrocera dorsalis TaxID=27457 RepID=A0ABM3J716_BACDO|nr:RNA polymerase II elongation factor Ell-like [Bactrocera dorsalis]
MASIKRIYNGRKPTRKIHPISASWNVNQSNISRSNGIDLFVKEKPQTGVKTKPEIKTESGKLPDISSRKLRERLVHMLALSSYTRQEINSIFEREGLLPCERPTVVYVLKDVAQLSRNVYSLRPNIWKEVDENWPYYNEKELQQMKRRKEQSLRAPNTPNSSIELTPESNDSQSSKSSTILPHPAENNSLKRESTSKRANLENVEPQPAKKRRIENSTGDNHATSQPATTKTNSNTIANHLKRIYNGRRPSSKMENQSNISRSNGTELFLKEKPQTGVKTNTEIKTESGKLPDISSRKLRERLVHMLAVNSYTRQEINSIFQREGLLPCERPTVVYVLKDVAQLSRNVYSLRPNIWKEVDENWPYYNEKELQQMKRRKEQSLRAPNSSIKLTPESSESQSLEEHKEQSLIAQNSSIVLTPESGESQSLEGHKEQSLIAQNSSIVLTPESNKSQSLKIHTKQSSRAPHSSIELTPESNDSQSSKSSTILPHPAENNSLKRESTSKRANLDNVEPQPAKKRRIENSTGDNHTSSQPATTKPNSNTIEPLKYDFSNYTEITSNEQRQQYAAEFARDHEEYMPLFQQTTELWNSFRELGAQILNVPEDCPEYENISERILSTFSVLTSREELCRKQRVLYLHEKLAHIKRLVMLFDSRLTKEIAMDFAMTMAKKYELKQDRIEAITDIEEVLGTSKKITIWHKDGATATTHDGFPPTKQEYISDILAEDLALSDSDSDDD